MSHVDLEDSQQSLDCYWHNRRKAHGQSVGEQLDYPLTQLLVVCERGTFCFLGAKGHDAAQTKQSFNRDVLQRLVTSHQFQTLDEQAKLF